jgi:predicted small lipoprotein YifL
MPTIESQKNWVGMKMNKLLRKIAASSNILVLLLANGCGLKGDLYIPQKETTPASPVAESNDDGETESETKADSGSD